MPVTRSATFFAGFFGDRRASLCHLWCIVGGLMSGSARALSLVAVITLGGCKLARNDEQSGRELPPPEPSAATAPSKPTELPAPAPRPRDADRAPTRPATTTTEPAARPATPAEPAPAPTAAPTDAPAPAPSPSPATGAAGSAPVALNPSCLPKCQATLQACVSKPPALDGGLPSLESLAECRKAFDDCRKECGI